MLVALALFAVNVLAEHVAVAPAARSARRPHRRPARLLGSFLVATFFNNFLPSNIGGDVIRIGDTAGPARSKTLATMVVLVDRVLGLMGLVLVAAVGATMASGGNGRPAAPIWPIWLWGSLLAGFIVITPAVVAPAGVGWMLQPLKVFHPEWVEGRIETLISALGRFRTRPGALLGTFLGAVVVQALMVVYYLAVVYAAGIPIGLWDLAVIVPISFVVQMAPVSVNGFGIREATFSLYFTRLGLPLQAAVLLSLVATVLTMVFSLTGAAVYVARGPLAFCDGRSRENSAARQGCVHRRDPGSRRCGHETIRRLHRQQIRVAVQPAHP